MKLATRKARSPAARRVAIYTRKSTSKGLDQEFNSLDAQRAACEAYVSSQVGEGWSALSDRYDDPGFSGATIERPGFQRLLEDIESGRVDIVVVYKIDRLSRSLLDFARIVQTLEQHGVEFVSVTQQFSTANSMGKLTLNILMSFAEFEREVISERTRDKIAATRRKGLWTGGHPPLGYDCVDKKLVVVEEEAMRVREVFKLYLQLGSLGEVANEMTRRGWRSKDRVTKAGRQLRGTALGKSKVQRLLTSVLYRGKVPYDDEVFEGRHDAIVDEETWDSVQAQLRRNRRAGGSAVRNKWGMLLKGLLVCHGCGHEMGHTYSDRGTKRYHYYICQSHKLPGNEKCPGARAPSRELEKFVIDRVRDVGKDPSVVASALETARADVARKKPGLIAEARRLRTEKRRLGEERENLIDALAESGAGQEAIGRRIGELGDEIETLEAREREVTDEIVAIEADVVDEEHLRGALTEFDEVWATLVPREQARVLQLVVEKVRFDGAEGEVHLAFRPGGVRLLAEESA